MRECGDCDVCCSGVLTGVAHGIKFYPGRPCHFNNKNGCAIYPTRPDNPCKAFQCSWLADDQGIFPEWLKPNLSNVLIVPRYYGKNKDKIYLKIIECGQPIKPEVLNWFFNFCLTRNFPIYIQVNGGWNYYGNTEFIEQMDAELIEENTI